MDESPAAGRCRIEVRARPLRHAIGSLGVCHLFLILRDADGIEHVFRGGPGNPCHPGVYGGILGTVEEYRPRSIDWCSDALASLVVDGPDACGLYDAMAANLAEITNRCIPYAPAGPNSNSVIRTLLVARGLPIVKPPVVAPGWDQVLL